ncbi:MAG: hypothetical protein IJA26_04430, partial [Clostridia bacterium]|nr:hypothetical protein [Clostridia bacterium]
AWTLLKTGERRLLLPLNATRTIDILCERENAHAVYIPGEISAWCAAAAEKAPRQFLLEKDGIACALSFISCLVKQGLSLRQWRESMPAAFRSFRKVRMDASQTGAALHSLFESHPDAQFGGGMRLAGENGWAWISPDDVQPEMCVMAEAAKHETADELCFFYADALERLIKQPND